LDFQERTGSFETFPLSALYEGKIDRKKLKGKIDLIGVSAESVKDLFYIPLNRGSQSKLNIAGVALHAHIISQILRLGLGESNPVETLTQMGEYGWIWLWAFAGSIIGLKIRSPWYFFLGMPLRRGRIGFIRIFSLVLQKRMGPCCLARPGLYAEAGLWYDAFAEISELIDANPEKSELRMRRNALLEQVGLQNIVAVDFE
jgi:hypothetical protein